MSRLRRPLRRPFRPVCDWCHDDYDVTGNEEHGFECRECRGECDGCDRLDCLAGLIPPTTLH